MVIITHEKNNVNLKIMALKLPLMQNIKIYEQWYKI